MNLNQSENGQKVNNIITPNSLTDNSSLNQINSNEKQNFSSSNTQALTLQNLGNENNSVFEQDFDKNSIQDGHIQNLTDQISQPNQSFIQKDVQKSKEQQIMAEPLLTESPSHNQSNISRNIPARTYNSEKDPETNFPTKDMILQHHTVYVSKLPDQISKADLRKWAEQFGEILDLFDRHLINRGIAFITYADIRSVSKIIQDGNGKRPFGNRELKVNYALKTTGHFSRDPSISCSIIQITSSKNEKSTKEISDIQSTFGTYGDIQDILKLSPGVFIVKFYNVHSSTTLVKLQLVKVDDEIFRIEYNTSYNDGPICSDEKRDRKYDRTIVYDDRHKELLFEDSDQSPPPNQYSKDMLAKEMLNNQKTYDSYNHQYPHSVQYNFSYNMPPPLSNSLPYPPPPYSPPYFVPPLNYPNYSFPSQPMAAYPYPLNIPSQAPNYNYPPNYEYNMSLYRPAGYAYQSY